MQQLKFIKPDFRRGLNVTVRNGTKWSERVTYGDVVQLADADSTPHGYATVFDVRRIDTFDAIPDVWLQLEHDRSCETKLGLVEAMDRAYPEGWGPEVTVLMFIKLK